jgi:hypothetical protein
MIATDGVVVAPKHHTAAAAVTAATSILRAARYRIISYSVKPV